MFLQVNPNLPFLLSFQKCNVFLNLSRQKQFLTITNVHRVPDVLGLANGFMKHKLQFFFLGIYVIDLHKVMHNNSVEGEGFMVVKMKQKILKVWCASMYTPYFTVNTYSELLQHDVATVILYLMKVCSGLCVLLLFLHRLTVWHFGLFWPQRLFPTRLLSPLYDSEVT